MDQKDFLRTLLALAEKYDVPFSEEQALRCHEHVSLMLEWNRGCNLTRITDYGEIIEKHILDSLIPARWLPQAGPAIDIGSGAGFPGIPLKILHPELDMLLLESHRKKASFLKVVLSRLMLPKVLVLHERWEDLARSGSPFLKNPPLLATMRAVRLNPEHLSAASKILGPDGVFAWWTGLGADFKRYEDHDGRLEKAGMILEGRHSYSLPSTSQPRYLFIWRKRNPKVT
jgi:16S rRNA (guanine527-N7)-methyltransferase